MDERRRARVGTVSGLALLTGGTAIATVTGGRHSAFATIVLGLLTLALGHALMDEARRQAGRRTTDWARQDTLNSVFLAVWTGAAAVAGVLPHLPWRERAVAGVLAIAYASTCGYFVLLRRRTVTTRTAPQRPPGPPRGTPPEPLWWAFPARIWLTPSRAYSKTKADAAR